MTLSEVAKMLGVSEKTIHRKIREDKLPYKRLGQNGRYRFDRDEVLSWVDRYSKR